MWSQSRVTAVYSGQRNNKIIGTKLAMLRETLTYILKV